MITDQNEAQSLDKDPVKKMKIRYIYYENKVEMNYLNIICFYRGKTVDLS